MTSTLSVLTENIQKLSPEQICQVNDFVMFLRFQDRERTLVRSAAAISSPVLETIWNNPEDDAYDAL